MNPVWNLPARYEGEYCQLGSLIREEAYRHVDVSHELQPDCELCRAEGRDAHMRTIENSIWAHVVRGWARPTRDWLRVVFWNPVKEIFQEFDAALLMTWKDVFENLAPIANARPYTGRPQPVPDANAETYTGRRVVVVPEVKPAEPVYLGK